MNLLALSGSIARVSLVFFQIIVFFVFCTHETRVQNYVYDYVKVMNELQKTAVSNTLGNADKIRQACELL